MSTYKPTNSPVAALVAAVVFVGMILAAIVALAFGERLDSTTVPLVVTLVGLVVSTVPSLIAAAYAERASKDIRNGTVVQKAKEGAKQAIEEKGVLTTPPTANVTVTGALADDDPVERGRQIAEALEAYKKSQGTTGA